jgi:hypothetical protein
MKTLIDQLQNILVKAEGIEEKKLEDCYVRLELFKEMGENPVAKSIFSKLLEAAQENPQAIIDFFDANDKLIKAYIKDGGQGLINALDEI